MDIGFSSVLKVRPIMKPFEAANDIDNIKVGFIDERWGCGAKE